ncbi:MAG: efflux RND transporter periplasmic adaptor subunit [Nitrosomonadales bacterium]|nr:efflux RND transporter periplasmic adaptor subunit [Nitrosomonadales bacterium]
MKPIPLIAALVAATLAGSAGYFWGKQQVPVAEKSAAVPAERKILYYRNPMGLPDTSPVPKVDGMGMDYVPVYADEAAAPGTVVLSPDKVQKLGVVTEPVALRTLAASLRSTAVIEVDERRQQLIAPRFEGWVRQLQVNATGQAVRRGQPLLEVYSPELESALREYQLAQESGLADLAKSTRQRLRNWEISDDDLAHLTHGMANRVLRSPIDGVVLEKTAVNGARFAAGEVLYRIADLSSVWVQAEVAEQDQGALRLGQSAKVSVDAYPGEVFSGKVGFISPVLNPQTRTVQVRVELSNLQGRLRPAMYAKVELATGHAAAVLSIPLSAVLDSGVRQLALVQIAEGRFEPRTLQLGRRDGEFAEVLDGLTEGERVVTKANFLIDAESNLKAALGGFGHAHGGAAPKGGRTESALPATAHAGYDTQGAAEQAKPAVIGHQAQGTLDAINADGTASITHEAIKTLGWPSMTMNFALANSSLATGIKPGAAITFELVERKQGEYVITKLQAKPPAAHEGH